MARKVAYIFQWVVIIGLCLGILFWAIAILTDFYGLGITETFCTNVVQNWAGDDYTVYNTSCENSIKTFMWVGLASAALLILPLQFLYFGIFKQFYLEKAEVEVGDGGYTTIQ